MSPGLLRVTSASSSSSSGKDFPVLDSSESSQPSSPQAPGYTTRPDDHLEPIAIVGMGCRLPGDVASPSSFWNLMMNKGTGHTTKVPASRFNIDAHFHPNSERPGSFNVLGGSFLNSDLREFDPAPFGISPIEAMWMDPQQRKLLEVVYEAFENGGVTLEKIAGTDTGCYIGSFTSDFQQMSFKEPDFRHSYAATGVDPGIISNRIGHVFNLHGPSITVNTACSSSVYALHNACNALRNGECKGAVVGGTNLILTVDQHMNTAKLGVLSPTSICHTFDESADGYSRADGVGAIYIKRLGDALRDGDPIRAVIRSSAVNSNGKVPGVGITHPNFQGQVDVIRQAYRRANLDPALTGYFECHGTGTSIGDPLEVHAVSTAMTQGRLMEAPLLIGAVKTNIGHSEAASGLSAVIKAALAVEKGIIPPTRGLVKPNPNIKWDEWQVKVVTEPTPFPSSLPIRRVSVNSFGYGGTNGHVIIDNVESVVPDYRPHRSPGSATAPKDADSDEPDRPHLLLFSAHDKASLTRNIKEYAKVAPQVELSDLAHTLVNRRSWLASRAYAICQKTSLETNFADALQTLAEKKKQPTTVAFAFTGQGAQWPRMGVELIKHYPLFARTIRNLDHTLARLPDPPTWTLEESLMDDPTISKVNQPAFSQPLCTAVQVGLVELLADWGVLPVATVGHSSGEIAAAFAAGYISASEAIIAAYYRGKVVASVNEDGAMLAVGLGAEEASSYLDGLEGKVVIACHNSPSSVTLSGDGEVIRRLKETLDGEKIFARILQTGGKAYHSHHMQHSALLYEKYMKGSKSTDGQEPAKVRKAKMISSVTGHLMGKVIDHSYWSANLKNSVLFNQAVQRMMEEIPNIDMVVEVGPHSALSGPIRQICVKHGYDKLSYAPTLLRNTDGAVQLLKLAGELWVKNSPIDLDRITIIQHAMPDGSISETTGSLVVDLPGYQWNYSKELWAEPRQSREHRAPTHSRHDILGSRLPGGSHTEPTWRNVLRQRDVPWLTHHSLGGEAVFPAAGYFSMAIEAIAQLNELSPAPVEITGYTLRDLSIKAALVTPEGDNGVETLVSLRPAPFGKDPAASGVSGKWYDFNVSSCSMEDGHWTDCVTGTIGVNMRAKESPATPPPMQLRASGKSWNDRLRSVGFDYGATFQDMDDIRTNGKTYAATANTIIKQECGIVQGESRYVLHPGTVDACLQLVIVSIYAGRLNNMTCGAVPVQVDEVTIWVPSSEQLVQSQASAFAWTRQRGNRSFISGVQLVAKDGELLMDISDMRCVSYEAAVPQQLQTPAKPQPYMQVAWKADIDHITPQNQTDVFSPPTVSGLVDLLTHKNAAIKILDLDTNSAAQILANFESLDYTIAVPSDDSLKSLQERLSKYESARFLKVNDVAELANQDGQEGRYDLIIASELTGEDISSLQNIRRLSASGGRLLLTKAQKVETSWSTMLQSSGFSGKDLILSNPGDDSSIILSTAASAQTPNGTHPSVRSFLLVYRQQPAPFISSLTQLCDEYGWNFRLGALKDVEHQPGEQVIMLAEMEGPLFSSLHEDEFKGIQHLTASASSILWVTCGALLSGQKPEYGMTAGFARSLRSEEGSLKLVTLDTDPNTTDDQTLAQIVVDIIDHQATDGSVSETEYMVDRGIVYTSRLLPNADLNQQFADEVEAKLVQLQDDTALVGSIRSGSVLFQVDERVAEELTSDCVEVRVKAIGLNKEDVLVVTGSDYPTTFSHELAGIVTRIGSDVSHVQVGDHVVGFNFDRCATYQRTLATLVHKISDEVSFQLMATMPMAFAAAIYGLNDLARVEAGETVLILDGTGAAGLAAIQICRLAKAEFLVVSNSTVDELLFLSMGIPADRIITSGTEAVAMQTKRKADVIFGCGSVESSVARECWRSIAPFGRYVDYGRKEVLRRSVLDTLPLKRGANYLSFDLLDMYERKPHILAGLLRRTLKLYNEGSISPIQPVTIKQISELDAAIQSYSDRFNTGKLVISYEATDSLVKMLPSPPSLRLQADATYLLVGCLGGLGRSLTSWMIERGAKHLAFMSRSGADNPQAAALIANIESRGVTTTVVRADVTSRTDVEMAIRILSQKKPIRGVVHAAMVLNDAIFQNMNLNNWEVTTSAKVQGSLNLHEALSEHDLDFFVMTSSTSGTLGTPGQSNYAAGNAFLDALAHHRRQRGLPAVSLVLPMVLGVGYVAEHPEIEKALKRKGIYGIDEDELLKAFEVSMMMQETTNGNGGDHVIVGLEPSKLAKSVNQSETTDCFWKEDARFRSVLAEINGQNGGNEEVTSGGNIVATIKAAGSTEEAMAAVTECFVSRLSRLLLVDEAEFELDSKSIASHGVDSMIGAELRNWIFKEFMTDFPFQQLLSPTFTITKFAMEMCAKHGKEVK